LPKDNEGNVKLPLQKRIKISDDTYIFRFDFPNENDVFGLPIGMHVVFNENIITKEEPKAEVISRKYTPISKIT
jgi:NAD(P)H-flavin reductase